MCEYFVKADPIQYEQRSRTVRIRNALTSIRLENMVWDILAEMAEDEGCTTNALIAQFHNEVMAHRGEVPNFASFLRVTSMRYLHRSLLAMEKKAEASADATATVTTLAPGLRIQARDAGPKPLIAVGR
ncbi:MAG: ribbon-helix-helix domain-containing protein [Rhodoferax sp.]|uniref:ribbon-helix-helix domain-containing protein n=1 Tax=Rhodoferax sp. TaxID=50421 RepID=UPI003018D3AF